VVIADVSGKGVPAALFMMIAKIIIKDCSSSKSPKKVFESVNRRLCENNEANMFVTAFMGIYNISGGRFVYACAGHNPPFIKQNGGGYALLKTEQCFVLAWMENAEYKESEIFLKPGDVLYLYTDGVTEAMNGERDLFSEERLLAALNANASSPPKELLEAIKREVDNFADGTEQADDITMLALKVNDPINDPINNSINNPLKKLEIEAGIENLNKVLEFVNTELDQRGCPSGIQGEIDTAAEEIFMNIANYAYNPDKGNAAIFISVTDKAIIRFEDTGRPYNPLEQAGPDLNKPLMEREPGGLGIFLVLKLMDNVEYSRVENKNVLVITKAIN
jgi:sigma-B regulation protein RsbU (phosphoserine phosphatase)